MTPNWTWTLNSTMYTLNTYPRGSSFGPCHPMTSGSVFKIQGRRKSEMHRMTSNWTWTLDSQQCSIYTKHLSLKSKYLLYDWPFPRYKVLKNQKCSEWPQAELEYLIVKSTLYTLNTNRRSPNFGRFCSRTSRFRDTMWTKIVKIVNAPNDLKITSNT